MFTNGHIQVEYISLIVSQAHKGSQIQASAQPSTSASIVIQLCSSACVCMGVSVYMGVSVCVDVGVSVWVSVSVWVLNRSHTDVFQMMMILQ